MQRKSSRGNPWHDRLGRFCHGPESDTDTWGNPISDEQRQESVLASEMTPNQYHARTLYRNGKITKEEYESAIENNDRFATEEEMAHLFGNADAKKYYSKDTANDPPTPKQKRFAKAIASRLGKELPEENKKAYSEFIADNVDDFYAAKAKKEIPEPKPEPKPVQKPTPKPTGSLKMPTQIGKGQEGAIAFAKECAEAFGADTDMVRFYSKKRGMAKGFVGSRTVDGKCKVVYCSVASVRDKNAQIHTSYHETFHLARNGHDEHIARNRTVIAIEETMAETSAFTMCKENGVESASSSYAVEVVKILPRLKQSEKYKDCKTMSDFGKIFIADRRAGNTTLKEERDIISNGRFSEGAYLAQYDKSASKYVDYAFENVTKPKDHSDREFRAKLSEIYRNGMDKLKEGKPLDKLTGDEKLMVCAAIRRSMEMEGIL